MKLTPEQLEERLPVIRAACAGKVVQWQLPNQNWHDAQWFQIQADILNPSIQWRIKPEEPEVPGEIFANFYPEGIGGTHTTLELANAAASRSKRRIACRRYVLADETDKEAELHRQPNAGPTPPAAKPLDGWVKIYAKSNLGFYNTKEEATKGFTTFHTARVVEVPEEARERWIVENDNSSFAFRDPKDAEKWQKAFGGCVIHVIEKA